MIGLVPTMQQLVDQFASEVTARALDEAMAAAWQQRTNHTARARTARRWLQRTEHLEDTP